MVLMTTGVEDLWFSQRRVQKICLLDIGSSRRLLTPADNPSIIDPNFVEHRDARANLSLVN